MDPTVTSSAFGEAVPAVAGAAPESWRQNRRVELVLERYLVTLPPCPDWSRQSGTDFANLPHSNFGCATETNLGLMVAEPRDLVRGRGLAPADGVQQAEGIVRYRTGKVVELQEEKVESNGDRSCNHDRAAEQRAARAVSRVRRRHRHLRRDRPGGRRDDAADASIRQGSVKEAVKHLGEQRSPKLSLIDVSGSDLPLSDINALADVASRA